MSVDEGSRGSPGATSSLLARAADGDREAIDRLVERYWRPLREWAHRRLPNGARERVDTDDLVQVTLLKTLDRLGSIDLAEKGRFTAYLHQALLNGIRDEIRRAARRPARVEIDERLTTTEPTPLRRFEDREFTFRYRDALATLTLRGRQAVVLRLELGHSFAEIAELLDAPSANAARMLVDRSVRKLADALDPRA